MPLGGYRGFVWLIIVLQRRWVTDPRRRAKRANTSRRTTQSGRSHCCYQRHQPHWHRLPQVGWYH